MGVTAEKDTLDEGVQASTGIGVVNEKLLRLLLPRVRSPHQMN